MKNHKSLNDYLNEARAGHYALGHFNFATADVLRAIVAGAQEAGAPAVMVGTSPGEADFIGLTEAVALVKALRDEYDFSIFLNADHFKSFEKCKEAIDAGYDSVIIDSSKLPFDDNIAEAQKVVKYAAEHGTDVEGELGYLKGSSEVQKAVQISRDDYTQPAQAKDFVSQTGVSRLAIVFGNIHGIVTEQAERLDIEHLKKIIGAVPDTHIVLHGASGLADNEVVAAIKAGVTNVHFNTELRVAYAKKMDEMLHEKEGLETTPYKYMAPAAEEVKKLVAEKTRMFMGK